MNNKIFLSIVLVFSLSPTLTIVAMLSKPQHTQEDESEQYTQTELAKQNKLDAELLRWCLSKILNLNNISSLIGQGADVNAKDHLGATPLHYACGRNHVAAVELLIKHGAIVNAQSIDGDTPLHIASEAGHIESVRLLFDNRANINSENKKKITPLHKACEFGHFNVVTFLAQNGADINAANHHQTTALHIACEYGFFKIVDFLIKNGADVHARNYRNATPLFFACIAKDTNIMQALIDNGADINAVTTKGWSPLHVTALTNSGQACKLLLDLHANTDLVTVDGMSALDVAYDEKHADIIKLFKKYNIETEAEKQAYANMLAFFKELNQEEISKSNIHEKKMEQPEPKQEIISKPIEPSSSEPTVAIPSTPIPAKKILSPSTPSIENKPAVKISQAPREMESPTILTNEYQILIGENFTWPRSLNEDQKMLIKSNLRKLKNWPNHGLDVKNLQQGKQKKKKRNLFRLRVGNYRIIFEADTKNHAIKIHKIGLRKQIYKEF